MMNDESKNNVVTLVQPIQRQETTIDSVSLREPRAGELRGLKMLAIAELDVQAFLELLPRITEPALTKQELSNLPLADMMAMMAVTAGFFEGKPSPAA